MSAAADIELNVAEIQRFCMHDGPGVRTTVFLKGCPLRCKWCHNPEMQSFGSQLLYYKDRCIYCRGCEVCDKGVHRFEPEHTLNRRLCDACGRCADICPASALQTCGEKMSVSDIIREIKKDAAFYGENGGVTLSGGEPLSSPSATELLKACRENGINTAVETCGYFDPELIDAAVKYTDLFLWDIKDTDAERHKKYTGVNNGKILENLFAADAKGAAVRLRCILVNGVNTDVLHYKAVRDIKNRLKNCVGVDILPYHAFGGSKAVLCGMEDNGDGNMIPDKAQISELQRYLTT